VLEIQAAVWPGRTNRCAVTTARTSPRLRNRNAGGRGLLSRARDAAIFDRTGYPHNDESERAGRPDEGLFLIRAPCGMEFSLRRPLHFFVDRDVMVGG